MLSVVDKEFLSRFYVNFGSGSTVMIGSKAPNTRIFRSMQHVGHSVFGVTLFYINKIEEGIGSRSKS